jgi:hypothetical protein
MKSRGYISCAILVMMVILTSCDNEPNKTGVSDEKLFYPAFTFISQELRSIDSMDLALFRYEQTGDHEDTTIMEKAAFRKFVESIFTAEMLSEPGKYEYQRRIFMDETIGKITITMDALNPAATVRRMDMLMDPESDAIKSIYAEISKVEGDKKVFRKMTWTAGLQLTAGIEEISGRDTHYSRLRILWGTPQ